jgi:hypothetical protein
VIQYTRSILVDGQLPSLRAHALLVTAALVVLGAGIVIYRRSVQRAIEEI